MIDSVEFDLKAFEASQKAAEDTLAKLDRPESRKALIEAANAGLVNALRRHFRDKERQPRKSTGFPWFGRAYPKKYFWHGNRGTSVSESVRETLASPSRLVGQVSIASPALAHKVSEHPKPITPKGGRRYLAIPANPAAALWTGMPRDFPGGLRLAYSLTKDGHWLPALVAASNYRAIDRKGRDKFTPGGGRHTKGANEVVYWLVHMVNPRHDPTAMPPQDRQLDAARAAVATATRRLLSS